MNPLTWWRRRRDENDIHVHPDTGQLGAPVRHRAPVHGGRQALAQIRAEAPAIPAVDAVPVHVFSPSTLDWARGAIRHFLAQADDARTAAFENWEHEGQLRARAADLEAWLRMADDPWASADGPQVPVGDDYPPRGPEPSADGPLPEPGDLRVPAIAAVLDAQQKDAVSVAPPDVPVRLAPQTAGIHRRTPGWSPEPFPWRPDPAGVPTSRDGNTQVIPVYETTGGAR